MFYKKDVLKSCKKFTGKHLCKSLFLSSGNPSYYKFKIYFNIYKFINLKSPVQAFSCEFFQIFLGTFFAEQIWATASTAYPFICCVNLSPKMLLSTCFFLFPLNIFRPNNVDRLHVTVSGDPRQLIVTELIYC